MRESETVRRPRGRPKKPRPEPRYTIINLKGTEGQVRWLDAIHRDTHIPKSVIFRIALGEWGERNGYPPFPTAEDDQ